MERSNKYIFIYSLVMVVLVAVALTVVAVQLKPAQDDNIRIEKMQNILSSVHVPIAEIPKKQVIEVYHKYVKTAFAVNNAGEVCETDPEKVFRIEMANELKKEESKRQLPIFIAILDNGDSAFIVPLRGKGLWGAIWGYMSFKTDFNTIEGCMFDHKGETPGLGAEISQEWFQKPFFGKRIFDESGRFVSIGVMKKGQPKQEIHDVDAISGGTITSKGVQNMIKDNLESYQAYFKKHIKS